VCSFRLHCSKVESGYRDALGILHLFRIVPYICNRLGLLAWASREAVRYCPVSTPSDKAVRFTPYPNVGLEIGAYSGEPWSSGGCPLVYKMGPWLCYDLSPDDGLSGSCRSKLCLIRWTERGRR
jgi:hypothetical protein